MRIAAVAPSVRARSSRRRLQTTLPALVLVLATSLLLSGCGTWARIAPGAPISSGYVVNRDGHYYVGSRCSQTMTEVGVFLPDQVTVTRYPPPWEKAAWHAVSVSPLVGEYELFVSDQPGVSVIADDGTRPYSEPLLVYMHDDRGYWVGMKTTLDAVESGMVAVGGGVVQPWAEYWARPNRDFGC